MGNTIAATWFYVAGVSSALSVHNIHILQLDCRVTCDRIGDFLAYVHISCLSLAVDRDQNKR